MLRDRACGPRQSSLASMKTLLLTLFVLFHCVRCVYIVSMAEFPYGLTDSRTIWTFQRCSEFAKFQDLQQPRNSGCRVSVDLPVPEPRGTRLCAVAPVLELCILTLSWYCTQPHPLLHRHHLPFQTETCGQLPPLSLQSQSASIALLCASWSSNGQELSGSGCALAPCQI